MRTRLLLVVVCIFFASAGNGQASWRFRSDNYLGTAIGQLGSYGQVETVNGLYKGPWFVGLGTGMDFYRFRTVPLYLSVTRDLFGAAKKSGFFLNLNGGITLPWGIDHPLPFDVVSSTFSPTVLWSGGLGYRQKLSAKTDKALLFTASYEVKNLTEHQTGAICYACTNQEPQTPQTYEYDYVNRVFLLSVGFQF
jgi:hypothetical protein